MQDRNFKTSTIEGVNSTGDPSIGGSNLKLAITANQNDSERFNESFSNRGGGGGQSPPTPTVGKTLLNTSANLLPITTASDTFNNLKNLLKIDKGSSPTNNGGSGGIGKRLNEGGNSGHKRAPISGDIRNSLNGGGRSGASVASGHFSTGYSKNSAKIRQHDSDVSPRPRRSFQSDSSSSRYYNKNSDILGGSQAGGIGNNTNTGNGNPYNNNNYTGGRGGSLNANNDNVGGRSGNTGGGYNNHNSNHNESGRRNYQPHGLQSDGGYSRNLNSGSGSNYRSHQGSRYENGNGNGQQRQYGSSTNAGYNNNYNNNKSYGSRSTANDGNLNGNNYRSSQRERGGDRDRDRDEYISNKYRDYEDAPRGGGGNGRYNHGNQNDSIQNGSTGSNTNSLERRLPPSALRQSGGERGGGGGGYADLRDRSSTDNSNLNNNRSLNNRSPPIRGGDNALGGHSSSAPSSTVNSSSSSRGISPNSPALATASQHPTPAPTPPPSAGRWVPPSLRPQHGLTQAEKNDAVFRKVWHIQTIMFYCFCCY